MDQHVSLERPVLGTPSRVSKVMRGKKGLSMAMVQRLRARFHVPADLLLPPPKKSPSRRSTKRIVRQGENDRGNELSYSPNSQGAADQKLSGQRRAA